MASTELKKEDLIGLTVDDLRERVVALGEPTYRARQIYEAIYRRRVLEVERLTGLPGPLRAALAAQSDITSVRVEKVFDSLDRTRRFLLMLEGAREVEAVFMPEERRDTICISSQAGCPLACDFCMTGVLGLQRDMTAGEIVAQVLLVLNAVYGGGPPARPTNIVIMGMGEPLLNYDQVMKAIRLITDEKGIGIPARRITLSTAGITPRIYDLAKEPVRPRLAISLSAPNEEIRGRLFPIQRKYSLEGLMEACRRYPLGDRERLTFEYVMLAGVNDADAHARQLVRLLSGIKAKVNLIPHNPAPELPYVSSPPDRILAFQRILVAADVLAFIRRPRGLDISAACGQLAARHEATVAERLR